MTDSTNNTGIPLEYVEFELKHAKVIKYIILLLFYNVIINYFRNIWRN